MQAARFHTLHLQLGQRLLTEQLVGAGDTGIPFTNPYHIRPAPPQPTPPTEPGIRMGQGKEGKRPASLL